MDLNTANRLLKEAARRRRISEGALGVFETSHLLEATADHLDLDVDRWNESSAFGVTLVADNSGSIASAGRQDDVIDGTNRAIDVLAAVDHSARIMVQVVGIDGTLIFPFQPVREIGRLNHRNYQANSGTPLYDTSVAVMLFNVLFVERFQQSNIRAKTSSLLVTDGEDQHSRHRMNEARIVIGGLQDQRQKNHLIAAMGIGSNTELYRRIFTGMEIAEQWIFTPGTDRETLMRLYTRFSQASSEASRTGHVGRVIDLPPSDFDVMD